MIWNWSTQNMYWLVTRRDLVIQWDLSQTIEYDEGKSGTNSRIICYEKCGIVKTILKNDAQV